MAEKTYPVSDAELKKAGRLTMMQLAFMPLVIGLILFVGFPHGLSIQFKVIVFFVTMALVGLIFAVTVPITQKKMKDAELLLDDEKLVRVSGGLREEILFSEVKKAKHIYMAGRDINALKLLHGGRWLSFNIFGNMGEIIEHVKAKLEEQGTEFLSVKKKLDLSNPLICFLYYLVFGLVMALIIRFNRDLYDYINVIIILLAGFFVLVYGPISRSAGKKFRKFELVVGPLLIGLGIINLVLRMLG